MDDPVAVGRRVAAARKRAGIKTRGELTGRVGIPRFGPATLGKVERGQRPLGPHEAPLLARALSVPVAYFYEDDEELSQLDRMEELLIENQDLMRRLAAGLLADAPADPPWQNLAEVLASLDARDRAASPHVPQPRKSSTG